MLEQMSKANQMAKLPGFYAMRAQQEAFFKAMTGGLMPGSSGPAKDEDEPPKKR